MVDSTEGIRLNDVPAMSSLLLQPPSQTLTGLIWGPDGLCHHLQEVCGILYLPTIPVFPVLYRETTVTTGIPGFLDFDRKTTGGTEP